jgi:hypothetical protein
MDCNIRVADMPSGVINNRSKRVLAPQQIARITRSRKTTAQANASLPPSDICVPSLSHDHFDGQPQATVQG